MKKPSKRLDKRLLVKKLKMKPMKLLKRRKKKRRKPSQVHLDQAKEDSSHLKLCQRDPRNLVEEEEVDAGEVEEEEREVEEAEVEAGEEEVEDHVEVEKSKQIRPQPPTSLSRLMPIKHTTPLPT